MRVSRTSSRLSLTAILLLVAACGSTTKTVSCTVVDNGDGTSTISCPDGTSAIVHGAQDGKNGVDGVSGLNGTNGTDGVNGTNGTNGIDGPGGLPAGVPLLYLPGGTQATHVTHGTFWKYDIVLPNAFCWDVWMQRESDSDHYIVSDSYGGQHALLWSGTTGNIWTGSTSISFISDDEAPDGVVSHYRVAMATDVGGQVFIWTYINGIPVGQTPMVGTRTTHGSGGGPGTLFVGGSDHQNVSGYLSQLRGYDTVYPFGAFQASFPFAPQRFFTNEENGYTADFLASYMQALPGLIPDLSIGYNGGSGALEIHPGAPENVTNNVGGSLGTPNLEQDPTQYPLPAPTFVVGTPFDVTPPRAPGRTNVAPPVPASALVFDSFSRDDQTYAHSNAPSLGSTEAGSVGSLLWQSGLTQGQQQLGSLWGIFNGRAVILEGIPSVAWVDDPALPSDVDIRVDRRRGGAGNGETGIAFRVVDALNYWSAYYTNSSLESRVRLNYWVDGQAQLVDSLLVPTSGNWITMRVIAKGTDISVLFDDVPAIQQHNQSQYLSAHGVGLSNRAQISADGISGLARWDNFTVLPAP